MAPVVTAIQPPQVGTKIKRPIPPGIQTNGAAPMRSSPSPSMSAKKPPPAAPAATNGSANPAPPVRPVNRARRENSIQIAGRSSRNSAGLRSASLAADMNLPAQAEPRPYIVKDEYILKKYQGNPPSLVVHLHPNHFKFDQQDGIFPYKSPMRTFIEHMRKRTVPHDLLDELTQAGVPFYEGCLIVQVHDHKSVAKTSKDVTKTNSEASTVVKSSIHNHTPYLTPSPFVPYPKDSLTTAGEHRQSSEDDMKDKTDEERDKESMPAPGLPEQKSEAPPKPKIRTIVLHPTQQSLQTDLAIKAATPRVEGRGSLDAASHIPPSTPMSVVPPTPTLSSMPPPAKKPKKERMELDGSTIYAAESQILLATTPSLFLEPSNNKEDIITLLDALAHPKHSDPPPQPKTRKRTVAEMAADQALAADQERYMLALDERLVSTATNAQNAEGGDGDAVATATFEPRFQRFKLLENIKQEHEEKQEQERIKQAENERRIQQQKLQQQQQEQQAQQEAQRRQQAEAEAERRLQQQKQQQQQLQESRARQEAQRRMHQQAMVTQQAAAAAAAQAQQQAAQAQQAAQKAANSAQQAAQQQAAAQANAMPNSAVNGAGMPPAVRPQSAQPRFNPQVSQAAASSPIVRQGTPHDMSSPMVGSVPMQQSNSNMAASPSRPPSVVQNHAPVPVPMTHSRSARGSQQSHPSGTPRMLNSTPNMAQATPVPRPAVPQQMVQTPRMTQASPPPMMMAQGSQMGAVMANQPMMGAGPAMAMNQQQLMAARLAQQQRMIAQQQQQQQLAVAAQQQGLNAMAGLNPQQQQQIMHQQMLQRQLQQAHAQQQAAAQNPGAGMMNQQLAQQYQQTLNNMQLANRMGLPPQMQQQMQAASLAGQMGNPNQRAMMAGMVPNHNAVAAAAAAAQQQQQQAMMNSANMNPAMIAQMQQQQQHNAMNNPNQMLANQARVHGQQLYNKNIQQLAAKFGGQIDNIPPEVVESFKRQCMETARNIVTSQFAQRRAAAVMMQQHQQQQQAQQQAAGMQQMGGMMGQGM